MFGVIFDMDGVLVMTEEAHMESWRRVARGRGIELSHDIFLSCFGRTNPDCIRIMFGDHIEPDESRLIADAKESAFREIIGHQVPLADGLYPLLDELVQVGARLAVGSSAPAENIDLVLDAGGLRRYFSATVNGSQVERGKPAPDVFLQAARGLSLEPSDCVVVEDAPSGIAAACAAGARAIGVTTTNSRDDLLAAGAHAVFPDVASLSARSIRHLLQE